MFCLKSLTRQVLEGIRIQLVKSPAALYNQTFISGRPALNS